MSGWPSGKEKVIFPESSKIRKWKEPAVFFHCHLHMLKIGKKIVSEEDGANSPDGVQWANASGCRSHYKPGLVVGKVVREPKGFQG